MTRHTELLCASFLLLISVAAPSHATEKCSYYFATGSGETSLSYCVTANGNILQILTAGQFWLQNLGEGYGICNESPAQNYTDYGASDTGNWNSATLVSQTSSSVKIARTTADGNWTLTQTITLVPSTSAIKVVMALTNNHAATHTAYLTRWADAVMGFPPQYADSFYVGSISSATIRRAGFGGTVQPEGLQLENVGKPPFGFWHGYALYGANVPNACAFAYYEGSYGSFDDFVWQWGGSNFGGSIEMAYVGPVGAHQTKTVTLSYHAL